MSKKAAAPTKHSDFISVHISSPYKVYYDGEAKSASATNATGPFDVLPGHHNFLSLLSSGEIVITPTKGENERFPINGGVIHVAQDVVRVFLDV